MSDYFPKGCRARHEAIQKRAVELYDQFSIGNRKLVASELQAMGPLESAAVSSLMVANCTKFAQNSFASWLLEVA